MLEAASSLDCEYIATGHFARTHRQGERIQILRGSDPDKDQSYALYGLPQSALRRTLFPLGTMTKEDVREAARRASLPTWGAEESQDICFIPEGDYRSFLAPRVLLRPGPIRDTDGNVLGTHQGLPFYTVGQRKGLGIPAGRPIYVIAKDPEENLLVVGPREALCRRTLAVNRVNWVSVPCPSTGSAIDAEVELRYRTTTLQGTIRVRSAEAVQIDLPDHAQAVAPGQSAVWYKEEVLIGGGIIHGSGVRDQGSGPHGSCKRGR
jgi:tRNA-specific 2-thiouridylase